MKPRAKGWCHHGKLANILRFLKSVLPETATQVTGIADDAEVKGSTFLMSRQQLAPAKIPYRTAYGMALGTGRRAVTGLLCAFLIGWRRVADDG